MLRPKKSVMSFGKMASDTAFVVNPGFSVATCRCDAVISAPSALAGHGFIRTLGTCQENRLLVKLASALCLKPKIVLFSVPTNAFDPELIK